MLARRSSGKKMRHVCGLFAGRNSFAFEKDANWDSHECQFITMATLTSIISTAEGEVREENFCHYKPAPVRHTCSVCFANVKIMFRLLRKESFPGESQLLRHRQWGKRGKFFSIGKFKKTFILESRWICLVLS